MEDLRSKAADGRLLKSRWTMVARRIRVKVRGNWHTVEVPDPNRYPLQVIVDGEPLEVEIEPDSPKVGSDRAKQASRGRLLQTGIPVGLQGIIESDSKLVRCPMPGRIVSVPIKVWDKLAAGSELCVLETMKMEQSIQISREGTVRAIFIEPGGNIAAGDPILQLE